MFGQTFKRISRLALAVSFAWCVVTQAAPTNTLPRKLSLPDCIQIALEHNLDVKVARFGPEIAGQFVSAAYGAYEPTFEAGGIHSYSTSPGGIDEQNRPYPGTTTEGDAYRAGIVGLLPTGLRVDLGANLSTRNGLSPSGPFENADGSASIQLRQPILRNFWIDNTRLTIQVRKKQLQISELALRGQTMNVVTAVQLAYYDMLLAQERIKVQEQALQLAERLVRESKRRVEVGTVARRRLAKCSLPSPAILSQASCTNAVGYSVWPAFSLAMRATASLRNSL